MQLCPEEIEQDPPVVVAREVVEVWEEEEAALAGWEVINLGPDPVVLVSAPVAERVYHIR